MRMALFMTVSFFATGVSCWGQGATSSKANVTVLLAKLHSTKEPEREEAFEKLRSNPANLQSPKVRTALLELLDRENHENDSQLAEAQKKGYPDEGDNEGYAEYYGNLLGIVDSFADWNNPRQACILAEGAYNDDSAFAARIVAHAKVTVPCLLKKSQSPISMNRAVTVPVLVQALAKANGALDPQTVQAAKQIVLRSLQDADEAVRAFTVGALGEYGAEDMIPALRKVAKEDPAPGEDGRSISTSAVEAIAAIEKRSSKGRGSGIHPQN
jgi:hypothetical protein